MSGQFYVFRCTGCRRWGSKEQRRGLTAGSYKCTKCGRSKVIKPKNKYGVHFEYKGPFLTGYIASEVVKKLNEMEEKELEKENAKTKGFMPEFFNDCEFLKSGCELNLKETKITDIKPRLKQLEEKNE